MSLQLTGSDWHGSPFVTLNQGATSFPKWGPFGGSSSRTGPGSPPPGFNGERQDPLTGVTHLGNGYRAYSPALRRFTCPDSESPFGVGGINPYAYCNNDPINQTDPDGHGPLTWMLRQLLKIGLRIGLREATLDGMSSTLTTTGYVETGVEFASSAATGIASESLAKSNPEVSAKLGWASLGLGLAASLRPIADLAPRVRRGMKGHSGRLSRTSSLRSEELVTWSGEVINPHRLSPGITVFEDTDNFGRRLNINAHGVIKNGRSYLIVGGGEKIQLVDAESVKGLLDCLYENLDDFNSIRVLSCYSGDCGPNSFAARLHQLTGKHIKAYSGTISGSLEPNWFSGFLASGGDENNDFIRENFTKTVTKTNPYSPSDPKYATWSYNPVYFPEKRKR